MSARFVYPKQRLAALLATPEGLTVAEAVAGAQANLDSIKPTCQAELVQLLDQAEACHDRLGAAFDDADMAELYSLALCGVGAGTVCGAPAVDEALTSLCDLIDNMRTRQVCDRDSIGVNLRAWRLLMTLDLPKEGAESVLKGLRRISARYADRA